MVSRVKQNIFHGLSVMHVLGVTSIHYSDSIALNGVSVIPFVRVGHVITFPSLDGRFSAQQGSFYGVNVKDGITHVALHVFIRIGMAVLQGDIYRKS